ncbi:ribonucleoside hydrolase RihC [Culicoidibacter larvae]|uniref:Ribonucleoside hydrolase RihC n=1 Tax=Culicoidibacter larvae TaxID=2579976 RepID=A0A5R8QGX8_9FIRM|nr:ribonucleoside hydrolase RihC [Culicoidibacter larvae]TLG76527.1 ribonucleoside hydrolase RihC [Culicoidibacter larvae]
MGVKPIPIIIDTDPGIDDAVAIAAAIFDEQLDVRLITTVAGNVNVEKTTDNALKLMEFFNQSIPVAKGCGQPLLKELEDASEIHGESGMAGYDFPKVTTAPLSMHAVEAMRQTLSEADEPITLVPIAALTNIALLFSMYPECKSKIKRIVMMGGSLSRGNTTTIAEFNTYVDPHAAAIVFQSGVPIVMVGLDVTSTALITKPEIEAIKSMNKTGKMIYSLFQHYRGGSLKSGGLKMHDLCAIAFLVKPELFTTQETYVEIEYNNGPASGATIADLKMAYHDKTNAEVCLDIDIPAFQKWFVESVGKMI